SYLQEWLPHVAQHNLRTGKVDFVGLGRLILPYPDFPSDVLAGRPLQTKLLCRTFSDCTTAPRNGLVSGCYPLDPFYKSHPEAERVRASGQRLGFEQREVGEAPQHAILGPSLTSADAFGPHAHAVDRVASNGLYDLSLRVRHTPVNERDIRLVYFPLLELLRE